MTSVSLPFGRGSVFSSYFHEPSRKLIEATASA